MFMGIKYKILLTVSGIMIITLTLANLFVNYNFTSIMQSAADRVDKELFLKWQVEGTGLITRFHKLLRIYEDIALSQAAFYTRDDTVLKAYGIAVQGNPDDPYDSHARTARSLLKQHFKGNIAGYSLGKPDRKFRLHFHTANLRSLARVWLDGWQTEVNGEKVDISDDLSEFRKTLIQVRSTRKSVSGVEVGKEGLEVRGICPIFAENGNYAGSVEYMWPLSQVIKDLITKPGIAASVFVGTEQLKYAERIRNNASCPVIGCRYVRIFSSDDATFDRVVSLDLLNKIYSGEGSLLLGDYYLAGTRIIDFSGKPVGLLLISINISEDLVSNKNQESEVYNKAKGFKFNFAVGSVFLLVLIVIIIYLFLSRVFVQLERTTFLLEESEENFRNLFMNQIDGYSLHEIILDKEGIPCDYRIILVNPVWEEQTGLKASEAVGKRVLELIPNLEYHWIEKYGKVAVEQKPMVFESYVQELNKFFEVFAFSPKKMQFACISKDITKQKKDEMEKSKMQEELLYSEKMRVVGQLAGGVAHDFNNKLSVIIGATELLQKKLVGEDCRRLLDMTLQAADYAADLSQKLLTFGHRNFMPFYEINAQELLSNAVSLLRAKALSIVRFEELYQAESVKINGDKSQLFSCFINIGMNAYQAMTGEGIILVKMRNIRLERQDISNLNISVKPGYYLKIEFKDTGKGIAKEHMDKIFEPFFSTKGVGGGSGLGLPAVLGTVEHHGGGVRVESVVGIGTSVTIYLPCLES